MLINLTIENFLSFDAPVSFSLEAGRKTSRHENHLTDVGGIKVLRGAIVYGANASGKSNLLKAVDIFSHMFYTGDCSIMAGLQFALGERIKPDMSFDVVYAWEDIVFRYIVKTDGAEVKFEKLSLLSGDREALLFERTVGAELALGDTLATCEWYRQRTMAARLLYLPKLLSDGLVEHRSNIVAADVILAAYTGLQGIFVIGADSKPRPGAFYEMFKQEGFKDFLLKLLKRADLGVSDLVWEPIPDKEAQMHYFNNPFKGNGAWVIGHSRAFILLRKDENGVSGEELRLQHNGTSIRPEAESDGTIRLLHLAPMLFQMLNVRGTWFVDEADCHMHPFLVRYLIKTFMDRENSGAQLVVTAHDTNLMTHDIWRTDEVWFAEKRVDGSTDLYSLYQFQPRHDKNLERGYLQGLYGALPCLGGEMVYEM